MDVIYVSHPYMGREDERWDAELKVQKLAERFPDVLWISPLHTILRPYGAAEDFETDMEPCIELLSRCDGMVLSDGVHNSFKQSRGCSYEIDIALLQGIPILGKLDDILKQNALIIKKPPAY